MNPIRFLTRPIEHLADALLMPFKAVFVVSLCGLVNWMTYHGHWWVQWVALGMGIAVLVALARAARSLALLALVGWVGWKIHQRWGAQARARFDAWVQRTQPQAAQVLQAWRAGSGSSAGAGTA